MILIFQHNNLTSVEWTGIRRELARALQKADEELAAKSSSGKNDGLAEGIKLNIIQTSIFGAALRIVEFYDPSSAINADVKQRTAPTTSSPIKPPSRSSTSSEPTHNHGVSKAAYDAVRKRTAQTHGLEPLLSGPLAIVPFPALSPVHLAAVLRILVPDAQFVAPKRKANPTYHEPAVQTGLQKLMLLGARVEGRVFDNPGVKWVGSLEGGLEGLRAQLVGLLTAAGSSLAQTLEMASKSVYFTVEGRRQQLEDDGKPKGEESQEAT